MSAAEHTQAVDRALWKIQDRWNDKIELRLAAVESKVIFASGIAAAVGALVGSGAAVLVLRLLFGAPG